VAGASLTKQKCRSYQYPGTNPILLAIMDVLRTPVASDAM
jgi:hypothetical protein